MNIYEYFKKVKEYKEDIYVSLIFILGVFLLIEDFEIKIFIYYYVNLVISYLKDLCSKEKVLVLAKKYSSNPVQIQRDRNNFITKKISNGLIKELKKLL